MAVATSEKTVSSTAANESARFASRRSGLSLVFPRWALAACCGLLLTVRAGVACEICGQPTLTLADRIARSDVVALGKWISARSDQKGKPASSVFEIVRTREMENPPIAVGKRVTLRGFHEGVAGTVRLLTGRLNDDKVVDWDEPLEMTDAGWRYATEAPDPKSSWAERLAYYLEFLEHADVIIANDAHAEVVNAPTADIAAAAGRIGPQKLREWLSSPKTPATRKSAYWVLLGYCGENEDERQLKSLVEAEATSLRLGLPGLIFGYLQLSGETGLKIVEERYLRSPPSTDELGEVGDAIKAVSWCWSNGNGKVSRESLRGSLRPLYVHPLYGITVLQTLARWKDWELLDELVAKYGTPGFNDSTMKKCIARFLVSATLDLPADQTLDPPKHVKAAQMHLKTLRQRDPKLIAAAERELAPMEPN